MVKNYRGCYQQIPTLKYVFDYEKCSKVFNAKWLFLKGYLLCFLFLTVSYPNQLPVLTSSIDSFLG